MNWKYCVIEYQQKKSEIILLGNTPAPSKSCFNILYEAPFDPILEDNATAFDACLMWIENNKVEGSKYAITEMFFV